MIDHEFLNLHGVRKSEFLLTDFLSGITALTALNWNANGVNDVPCRYKGVNGVLLEVNGVSCVYATMPEKKRHVTKEVRPGESCFLLFNASLCRSCAFNNLGVKIFGNGGQSGGPKSQMKDTYSQKQIEKMHRIFFGQTPFSMKFSVHHATHCNSEMK